MSYIEKNLVNGEALVFRARLHWSMFVSPVVSFVSAMYLLIQGSEVAVFFGISSLLGALILGVKRLIQYLTTEFGITNKRILGKVGFIRRNTSETLLHQVEGLNFDQGIMGRILDFGTVMAKGTSGRPLPFYFISGPLEMRKALFEQIEKQATVRQASTANVQ